MVVFLFTDIEGSTRLWERYGDLMGRALILHDAILEEQIGNCGGRIIKHTGDGIFAVFEDGEPLHYALDVQRQFGRTEWGVIGELQVRMALHAGDAQERNGDYFGVTVNRTAKLLDAGRGRQILLTSAVASVAHVPLNATLQNLGIHQFKDLSTPQRIYGLEHPDLTWYSFPLVRSLSTRYTATPTYTSGRVTLSPICSANC